MPLKFEFLYLIESKNLIAVLPVFKLAENKSELKKYSADLTKGEKKQLKKEEREAKRKAKFQEIIDRKYAESRVTPQPKKYEHLEATIEYVKEGGYYLIKYEKGFIRAWSAVKAVK